MEERIEIAMEFTSLEEAEKLGYKPHTIERYDGELISLNSDNKTYSFHKVKTKFPNYFAHRFSYEYINDWNFFKVITWSK